LRPLPCSHHACIWSCRGAASQGADFNSPERQGAAPLYLRGQTKCAGAQRAREISGLLDRQFHRLGGLIAVDPASTTFAMWFCSWRASDRLEILQALQRKKRGCSTSTESVARGASARNLAHGPWQIFGRPTASLVWALKQKNGSPRRSVDSFPWNFGGVPGCAARRLPPSDSLHLERPWPAPGPGSSQPRAQPGRAGKTEPPS